MKLILNKSVLAILPLIITLVDCAPSHEVANPPQQQILVSCASMDLSAAVESGWPQTDWWKDYHGVQLDNLIQCASVNAPDIQIAGQRIRLAKAQARISQANLGPEADFSTDVECQRMPAKGLMGPSAIDVGGNIGSWYTNGTPNLTADRDPDLWGKNRALVEARIGELKAQVTEQAQTCELLPGSVVCLY